MKCLDRMQNANLCYARAVLQDDFLSQDSDRYTLELARACACLLLRASGQDVGVLARSGASVLHGWWCGLANGPE